MAYIGKTPTPAALTASDITDGIITNAKLAQDIISAETELATAPADTDEFLISDAGVLKRIDSSLVGISGWSSNSGNLLPADASKGIYLGVNSATASNLLDDYEEGTWTPVITSGGNTLTVSGGTQFYKYIKIGKMCSLFYNVGNATISGTAASGDQRITGIPFQGATDGRQAGTVPMYYTSGGLRYNAKDFMMLNINSGATEIEIVGYDNSSGYENPGTPSTGSGTYLWWQLTYEVA